MAPIVTMNGDHLQYFPNEDPRTLHGWNVLVALVGKDRDVRGVRSFDRYPLIEYGLDLSVLFPHDLGWRIYKPPLCGSSGSAAVYIAERRGHLVQVISPNSRTSAHSHPDTIETFQPLYGLPWLVTEDNNGINVRRLDSTCPSRIQPQTNHMLVTIDSPSVNLLQISPPRLMTEINHQQLSSDETEQLYRRALDYIQNLKGN